MMLKGIGFLYLSLYIWILINMSNNIAMFHATRHASL